MTIKSRGQPFGLVPSEKNFVMSALNLVADTAPTSPA